MDLTSSPDSVVENGVIHSTSHKGNEEQDTHSTLKDGPATGKRKKNEAFGFIFQAIESKRDIGVRRRAAAEATFRAHNDARFLSDPIKALNNYRAHADTEPSDVVEIAIREHQRSNPKYSKRLQRLPRDRLTKQQIQHIEALKGFGPFYLGRTASRTCGYRHKILKPGTNGCTMASMLLPAAEVNTDEAAHPEIISLDQGELVQMLGAHLMWQDTRSDEFLSYSNSATFLVIHALDRHHEGQGGVTIQFIDRRKATKVRRQVATLEGNTEAHSVGNQSAMSVTTNDRRGQTSVSPSKPRYEEAGSADFYRALGLYEAFEVPSQEIHQSRPADNALRSRKFTQEYLSHGNVLVRDSQFRQASIDELIADGLYDVFPEFEVPDGHIRKGLYEGQVYVRKVGFPPNMRAGRAVYSYDHCAVETPMTTELLTKVQKLTRNFMNISNGVDPETVEPHLHVFLCFLSFQKRNKYDAVFVEWIREYYKRADVLDLYWDPDQEDFQRGFTHVASNLPEFMQYLDLVRLCCTAFELPMIPPNRVETVNPLTAEVYASEDTRLQKRPIASVVFDEDAQEAKRARRRNSYKKEKQALLAALLNAPTAAEHPDNSVAAMAVIDGSLHDAAADDGNQMDEISDALDPDRALAVGHGSGGSNHAMSSTFDEAQKQGAVDDVDETDGNSPDLESDATSASEDSEAVNRLEESCSHGESQNNPINGERSPSLDMFPDTEGAKSLAEPLSAKR